MCDPVILQQKRSSVDGYTLKAKAVRNEIYPYSKTESSLTATCGKLSDVFRQAREFWKKNEGASITMELSISPWVRREEADAP